MRIILTFTFFLFYVPIVLNSQSSCKDDSLYQLLNFWIGEWKVYENDQYVGQNQIVKDLNGCVVMENWTAKNGQKGKSLFYVDNNSGSWKQVWVTENAKMPWGQKEKELIFSKTGEILIFQGQYLVKDKPVIDRTILTKISDNEVRQLIQYSADGGQSWNDSFNGQYIRLNSYEQEILDWRSSRLKSLKRAKGWLSLTGLFWLKEGKSSFGSGKDMDIQFPRDFPDDMGKFILKDGKLKSNLKTEHNISIDGEVVKEADLVPDMDGTPSMFNWKSHFWYPIRRDNKFGIRLRDTLNPARFALKSIPSYPIDTSWRVKATQVNIKEGLKVQIDNIVGMRSENEVAAFLSFEKNGKKHELVCLDGGPDHFFVIIADMTSGQETYGGGRYIYVERPKEGNSTIIDFNKAYNPPCVFTDYATCPLPPAENHLDLSIIAGEKMINLKSTH